MSDVPENLKFDKKRVLRVNYRDGDFKDYQIDEVSEIYKRDLDIDLSKVRRAVIYFNPSQKFSSGSGYCGPYAEHPDYTKNLKNFQKPFYDLRIKAASSPVVSNPNPAPIPTPVPTPKVEETASPSRLEITVKPINVKDLFPKYNGEFVIFENGGKYNLIQNDWQYTDDSSPIKSKSPMRLVTTASATIPTAENAFHRIERPTLEILTLAEKNGANFIAEGVGGKRKNLYFLLQMDEKSIFEGMEKYKVSNLQLILKENMARELESNKKN